MAMNQSATVTATDRSFSQALDALLLDKKERQLAIDVHNKVTDSLRENGFIAGAFLQGSFARKTMIAPLRDIDKVVLLAEDPRSRAGGHRIAAQETAGLLRGLYPTAAVSIGRHCVTLDLGQTSLKFDVVPAVDLGDDIEIINITDRPGQPEWKRSNTRTLMKVVQERNSLCDGCWVHYVRLGKLLVRHALEGLVPGLHVEAFAFVAIEVNADHVDEAVAAVLATGAKLLGVGQEYFDPTGVDELGRRLDSGARAAAQKAFATAAADAQRAVDLRRSGEDNAACAIWYRLLGDPFPKASDTAALARLGAGSGVIGGVVSRVAPTKPPVTRSWRP
jgi:hypothetical protein